MSRALSLGCWLLAVSLGCGPELPRAQPTPAGTATGNASSPAPPSAPSAPSPAAAARDLAESKPLEARGAGPVVPPERLPTIDTALKRALGADGMRKLEVAASVCAAAVRRDPGKLRVGCRACPPFDAATGPDAKVVVDPEQGFYELEAVYLGSFTRPGADEAAAVFSGCEPHASNFGGTLLVERTGSVWAIKSYRSGFHPLDCKVFRRPDARDILVCRWQTDHQSYGHWLLDTYDFTLGSDAEPIVGWNNLLTLDDNSYAACTDAPDQPREIVCNSITGFRLEPVRGNIPARLLVDARLSQGPRTAAYDAKCAEVVREAESEKRVDVRSALRFSGQRLNFAWQGEGFIATAETRSVLEKLGLGR